jgi:putative membrane protein
MKKNKISPISITLITVAFLSLLACNYNHNSDNPLTESENKNPSDSTKNSADVQFLDKAAEINLEEIKVGTLAQQNGAANEVKSMGKMLEQDHTQSWNELTELARKKSVTIPTTLDSGAKADYSTLSGLSGKDFDKKFCNMMIGGHKAAIGLFEKESTQANDSDIKHWAVSTLPTLHKHLDDAISCQQAINNNP